jgi:asparagine synthase (glutamine-hydrolysing)
MPGILGIINGERANREQDESLSAMTYPLVFTPDQEVEWFRHDWYSAGTVGYGKSFSFLKKASAYKEGVLLIMDGEVFPEAKDVPHELAASAPTIQRAEYCLYLYLHHGPKFAKNLNGNFVIAVFDNHNRTVHLYNDRFGSQPLYLWTGKRKLVFATSQRSLLIYRDDIGRQYDKDALAELIVFERVLGNKTLLQDIRRLVPASHAVWDGKQLRAERYWDIPSTSKDTGIKSWKDAAAELNQRLAHSMAKRLADGARVAALVSGGVDSRLLLCFSSPQTIAATFSNSEL